MIKNSKLLTLLGVLLISPMLFWTSSAQAIPWVSTPTDVCPAPNGGDSGYEAVSATYSSNVTTSSGIVTNNTGCNVLITFNSDGSIATTNPNTAVSYDSGLDDNLVGIINNTSQALSDIFLSSATEMIFGFEGDGICGTSGDGTLTPGYTFVEGDPCSNILDADQYGGPYVTFAPQDNYSGKVLFGNGGIAPGASAFFSLEGPVDVNLRIVKEVPEPMSIALMGLGLLGLGALRQQRRKTM